MKVQGNILSFNNREVGLWQLQVSITAVAHRIMLQITKRPCMCVRIQTVITGILRGWDAIHTKKRSK